MRRALTVLLLAGAAWAGTLLPGPWGTWDRTALTAAQRPAMAAALLLLGVATVQTMLGRRAAAVIGGAPHDEPLLHGVYMPACAASRPVVAVVGLTPGAGASTIAFNMAITLAVDGQVPEGEQVRSGRPLCLLRQGALSEALVLRPVTEYFAAHPHRVDGDVVDLVVRHPSGCELLCVEADGGPIAGLSPLVAELRRHYDAVIIDGGLGDRGVLDVVAELADALILVGLPDAAAVPAAGRWIERVWAMGLQERTALIVNRVSSRRPPAPELNLAFLHGAELPDDPCLAAMDHEGLPWSLDRRLPASGLLVDGAAQLFPALLSNRGDHAG